MTTQFISDAQTRTTLVITETHVNAALLLVSRLLFGGYFVYAGMGHFMHHATLAAYAASRGVPAADLAVLGTGLLLIAGGTSIAAGIAPKVGAIFIAVFLLGVTPIMHAYWNDADPAQRANDLVNFTKNLALLGAAGLVAAIPEPWPLSPQRRVFEV